MSYTRITYTQDDGIATLTLQRPDARNALDRTAYAELEDAVSSCAARCLIITGAGTSFCAGDDVKQLMVDRPPESELPLPSLTPAARALLTTSVPVIAAVNGPAVGWGVELALLADLRVAARSARFAELFVARGLCPDVASLSRLPQLVGRERAAKMLFTGESVSADEAARIGLVGAVVPDDELIDAARSLAAEVARQPPLAVQAIKRGLGRTLDPDWENLGGWVSATLRELFRTEDHREGVASFLERRPPTFHGR